MIGISAGIVLAYYTACPVWAAGLVGLAVYSIPTLMLYFFYRCPFCGVPLGFHRLLSFKACPYCGKKFTKEM